MALPKPVSMSATTGRPERSTMARVMSRCWVIDTTLTSGTPYIAESSKPDAQIASKPASATSMADKRAVRRHRLDEALLRQDFPEFRARRHGHPFNRCCSRSARKRAPASMSCLMPSCRLVAIGSSPQRSI